MAAEWYYKFGDVEFGPVSASELVKNAADGKIFPDTQVRKGNGRWYQASKVASLFDRANQLKQEASELPSVKKLVPGRPGRSLGHRVQLVGSSSDDWHIRGHR